MSSRPVILLLEQGRRTWITIQNERTGVRGERLIEVGERDALAMTDAGVPLIRVDADDVLRVASAGDLDLPPMFNIHQDGDNPGVFEVHFAGLGHLGTVDAEQAERMAASRQVNLLEGMPVDWSAARAGTAGMLEAEARALRERADALDVRAAQLRQAREDITLNI